MSLREDSLIINDALKLKIEELQKDIKEFGKKIDKIYDIQQKIWDSYIYEESSLINDALNLEIKNLEYTINFLENEIEKIYALQDKILNIDKNKKGV